MKLRHGETKLHTQLNFIRVSAANNLEIAPQRQPQPNEHHYLWHAVKSEKMVGTDHAN